MTKTKAIQTRAKHDPDEIAHAQRTEQMEAIYQELNWISEQPLPEQVKGLMGLLWDRVSFVNQQAEIQEQRTAQWQAIAAGAVATAKEFETQRDKVLDEQSEFIKSIQDGTNPIVKELIAEAYQDAFEEYHHNAGRLVALVEKLRIPDKTSV
jgi:hypothetical protein